MESIIDNYCRGMRLMDLEPITILTKATMREFLYKGFHMVLADLLTLLETTTRDKLDLEEQMVLVIMKIVISIIVAFLRIT